MYGAMASRCTAWNVGPMTAMVMNSASPSSTWLGGICGVASAWRSRPSTTMIRVKLVTITSTAGATESTVTSSTSCSVLDTPSLVFISGRSFSSCSAAGCDAADGAGAAAGAGGRARRMPAAQRL